MSYTIILISSVQHNGSIFVYIVELSPQYISLTFVTIQSYIFSCDVNFQDLFSQQFSNIMIYIINYSHQAGHYISMTLFYNWKFEPFVFLPPFLPPPSLPTSGNHQLALFIYELDFLRKIPHVRQYNIWFCLCYFT